MACFFPRSLYEIQQSFRFTPKNVYKTEIDKGKHQTHNRKKSKENVRQTHSLVLCMCVYERYERKITTITSDVCDFISKFDEIKIKPAVPAPRPKSIATAATAIQPIKHKIENDISVRSVCSSLYLGNYLSIKLDAEPLPQN